MLMPAAGNWQALELSAVRRRSCWFLISVVVPVALAAGKLHGLHVEELMTSTAKAMYRCLRQAPMECCRLDSNVIVVL